MQKTWSQGRDRLFGSSLYILFCIGGGSLSSIVLGPAWNAWGWPGITLICSTSLATSLVLLLGTTARQPGLNHAS